MIYYSHWTTTTKSYDSLLSLSRSALYAFLCQCSRHRWNAYLWLHLDNKKEKQIHRNATYIHRQTYSTELNSNQSQTNIKIGLLLSVWRDSKISRNVCRYVKFMQWNGDSRHRTVLYLTLSLTPYSPKAIEFSIKFLCYKKCFWIENYVHSFQSPR